MLYEYAVEPQTIGSSWQTFRYLVEKFGFDKGRLISQFPKYWFREVYNAGNDLSDMQKKRVEEALNQAKKNKVVRCSRPYDLEAGDWLQNAIAEQGRSPFRAIIAGTNPNNDDFVLPADDLDELQPLMIAPLDLAVEREAGTLAAAMQGMLQFSSHILFIDPFFDLYNNRYKSTIVECLRIVEQTDPNATCEIHYRYHPNKPDNAQLEREAARLFVGVVPDGMKLDVYCWKERAGGSDFHARYLLTERGGMGIEAGFSAEGNHQTTDMHLMSYDLSQLKLKSFARDATDYELVEPVLRVSSDGVVEHI